MPQKRLTAEEHEFIMKLKKVKYSNCEIARSIGVTEGAIRYRIKREKSGLPDRRKNKPSVLSQFESVIEKWIEDYKDDVKRPTLKLLYQILRERHGYKQGYDAVRRYVRKHYPEFYKKGVYIRIETPPGSLIQIDWKEDLKVQCGKPGQWVTLHALIFSLGFSRKRTIIYSDVKDLDAFISCHQKAFQVFGGLAAFIRSDCLKTAIVRWRGRALI
ncbi:MAG: hypothetical protein ACMUJM_25165 [bacterium]